MSEDFSENVDRIHPVFESTPWEEPKPAVPPKDFVRAWVEGARALMEAATMQQRLSLQQRAMMKSLISVESMNDLAASLMEAFAALEALNAE